VLVFPSPGFGGAHFQACSAAYGSYPALLLFPLFFRDDLEGDDLFAELEGFWLQELPLLGSPMTDVLIIQDPNTSSQCPIPNSNGGKIVFQFDSPIIS
jgi:hypothetical protein